jgi:hypothetical protein
MWLCAYQALSPHQHGFEVYFETYVPRHQAQVDFAHFKLEFDDASGRRQSTSLFSIVLDHSRYFTGASMNLSTCRRCCAVT